MRAIYEPQGRAREYAELACNLFTGCIHGCKYCYAPAALRKHREDFHTNPPPRNGILSALTKDATRMYAAGDLRRVLLCFSCDPYQGVHGFSKVIRESLEILCRYGVNVSVLTKRPSLAVRDFDLMGRHGIKLGVTMSTTNSKDAEDWEPGADLVYERMDALVKAQEAGVYTWLSIEPVWNPAEALAVIRWARLVGIDHIKVGKMNHRPEVEASIDWAKFLADVRVALKGYDHYIKADLAAYGG